MTLLLHCILHIHRIKMILCQPFLCLMSYLISCKSGDANDVCSFGGRGGGGGGGGGGSRHKMCLWNLQAKLINVGIDSNHSRFESKTYSKEIAVVMLWSIEGLVLVCAWKGVWNWHQCMLTPYKIVSNAIADLWSLVTMVRNINNLNAIVHFNYLKHKHSKFCIIKW